VNEPCCITSVGYGTYPADVKRYEGDRFCDAPVCFELLQGVTEAGLNKLKPVPYNRNLSAIISP
jgi:hypothetical protein